MPVTQAGPTRPRARWRSYIGVAILALLVRAGGAHAQERVDIGTTAFVDYYYNFTSADNDLEGLNGFTYRRLYLTTDFNISDSFAARARLEANNGSIQAFVKDLYLRWTSDGGHRLFFGVVPPPVFDLTEEVWEYRSLEKTILDLNDIVDSRDFGVRADGPILRDGLVRYALMFGNNNAIRPEDDRYKRVYGRLDVQPGPFIFSAGGDFAAYGDERTGAFRVSGLAGYVGERLRAGVETFASRTYFEFADDAALSGASVFASWWFNPTWGLVGRFDRVLHEVEPDLNYNLAIAGVAFRPHEAVRFIPNLYVTKPDEVDEAEITGRVTLEIDL